MRCANLCSVLRRIAILFAVLLVASAALTAVAPRPDPSDDERPTIIPPAPAREGDVTDAVRGTLPRDRLVRARVGDNIELTVTARDLDSATVDGLGLTDAASPGTPAQFSFRADRAGRFPVTLTLSGRLAGRVVVSDGRRSSAKKR